MSANKQTGASADPLSFPADFLSGVSSSSKPLKGHTGTTPHRLAANFFPVILGEVNCIYQYRLDSIVKVKSDKPAPDSTRRPRYPKRAPLPRGQQYSTAAEKQKKAAEDAKFLKKFQNRAVEGDTGGNSENPDDSKGMSKRIRRRLAFLLIDCLMTAGVNVNITSDYDTSLFAVEPIQHSNIPGMWQVAFYDEDQGPDSPNLDHYTIIIGPAERTDVRSLLVHNEKAARANSHAMSDALAALTHLSALLNPFFSHCANAYSVRKQGEEPAVVAVGANKSYLIDGPVQGIEARLQPPWPLKSAKSDNPGGVVAYPGIFRSIRVTIGSSILLNINTTTSAFYMAGNLQTVLDDFNSRSPAAIIAFIKGLRVRTTYMTKRQLAGATIKVRERIYTVKGLPFTARKPVPSVVFFEYFNKAGNPIETSVAEYWSRPEMGRNPRLDPNGYVIDCGKAGFIPAQYLEVLPGQSYKPKTEMVAQACREPKKNYNIIMEHGLWLLGITTLDPYSPAINFSGLTIDEHMIQVPAVRFSSGQLRYRTRATQPQRLLEGRWNLQNCQASVPAPITGKPFIVLQLLRPEQEPLSQQVYNQFCGNLETSLASFGLGHLRLSRTTDQQRTVQLLSTRGQNREEAALAHLFFKKKATAALLIVILPDSDGQLYAQVKRAADLRAGLHTVCHVLETKKSGQVSPKLDPGFMANLVLKINLKLSRKSANQVLAQPTSGKLFTSRTMLVGIDVTHPGPGVAPGVPSVAAIVTSVDANFAQWPASLRINPRPTADSGQSSERVLYLSEMMEERLNDFKAMRGHLPDRLLIYRDGLSEAQFEMCTTLELPQIKQAVSKVYQGQDHPPILLVCAVKRHHTRLFPVNWSGDKGDLIDGNCNPKPGVAVFHEITYGENKDFYLVSHRTIQGTARPCHYVVLHNEIDNISITDVATATHHLCYIYARSTTSVSVATPAFYADLACDRARYYVRKWYVGGVDVPYDEQVFAASLEVHGDMKNSMFYL